MQSNPASYLAILRAMLSEIIEALLVNHTFAHFLLFF
jgi:hypothetical protein